MSSEEFRAQLYQSLQGRGILDSLKSQLRNRLAMELHKSMEGTSPRFSPPKSPHKSMRHQVADSIVANHLKTSGYEYSLSIFLPEAGITMDKLISEEDVIRFLQISPSSSLYRHLQSQNISGFLGKLLEALIASHDCTTSTQPTTPPPATTTTTASPRPPSEPPVSHHTSPLKKSVALRLEELDTSYARRVEEVSSKCQLSLEDRLSAFRHDLEARYKQQLETELALCRSRELAKVREEERQRYQEELAREKEALHQTHQMRLEEVKRSEQHMIEKYRRREQELEAGIYSQRQTLLDELNALRQKEGRLKREMELDKRAVELEKERAKAITEQLETNMKQMKTQIEMRAEEKLQQEKLEYEQRLKTKESELEMREAQLKRDLESVESLKLENRRMSGELIQQRKSTEKLQTQLQEATWSEIGLHKRNDDAQMKQIQFADYHHLKQKVAELKTQLSLSENKCSEMKEKYKQQQLTLRQLQSKLSQPSLELLSQQAELERLRKAHHRELLVLEYDNKQLSRHLAAQTEHSHQLQRRLDEQLLQLKTAQREVQDLHTLFEHAYPHAADQGLQRKQGKERTGSKSVPSPSKKISRSVRSSSVQPQQQQQQQQQLSKLAPSQSLPHNLSHSNHAYTLDLGSTTPDPKKGRNVSFFDTSGAFLAESRETISRMEKEAEQLERTYREFSYPVTGITDGGLFKHSLPAHLAPGPSPLLSDLDVPYPAMYGRYGLSTLTPSPPPPMAALSSIRSSSAYTHPPVSTTMAMHASFTSPLLQQQTPSPQPATTPEQPSPPTVTQTPLLVGQPGIGTVATTTSVHLASSSSPSPSPLLLPVTSVQQSVAVQPSSDPQPLSSAARLTPSSIPSAGAVTAPETTSAAVTAPETTSAALTAPETTSAAVTAPETRLNPLLAVSSTITPASALPPTSITSSTTVYPASPLDSDAPGKVSVVVGLPTSSNEGSSSAQPKSVMSLDSWWNVSKPDNADKPLPVTTFTTQHTQEDKASSSLLVTPVVDALAPSHAYTSLTGSVHSPISSIAVSIAGGQLQKVRGTSSSGGAAAVATAAAAASENSGKKDLPTNIVPTSQPPQAGHHPAPTGGGNAGLVREEEGEKPKEEDEDDGIDPVMLKYMQLVKEKRQERQTEQLKPMTDAAQYGTHSEEFDISQDVGGGFNDFSNHDQDDPFENW